jgi:hypothetical protein
MTYTDLLASLALFVRRAEAVCDSIQARAWKLAATVGIPRDLCCLHNASLDDDMKGWCHGNPHRLQVAKQAVAMFNASWAVTDLGWQLWRRGYNRGIARGYAHYPEIQRRPVNVHLLFAPLPRPQFTPYILQRAA